MKTQPFEDARYSTHDMGMTFELAAPGELYMMCQGAGSGHGDVLQRDPALVMQDLAEDLIAPVTARGIYPVAFDPQTRVLDRAEPARPRDAGSQAPPGPGKPTDTRQQEHAT